MSFLYDTLPCIQSANKNEIYFIYLPVSFSVCSLLMSLFLSLPVCLSACHMWTHIRMHTCIRISLFSLDHIILFLHIIIDFLIRVNTQLTVTQYESTPPR